MARRAVSTPPESKRRASYERAGSNETRRALVQSAMALWRTQGYAETSVVDICKAAGVSRALFYFHFDGKEDILFEVGVMSTLAAQKVIRRTSTAPTIEVVIKAALQAMERSMARNPRELIVEAILVGYRQQYRFGRPRRHLRKGRGRGAGARQYRWRARGLSKKGGDPQTSPKAAGPAGHHCRRRGLQPHPSSSKAVARLRRSRRRPSVRFATGDRQHPDGERRHGWGARSLPGEACPSWSRWPRSIRAMSFGSSIYRSPITAWRCVCSAEQARRGREVVSR